MTAADVTRFSRPAHDDSIWWAATTAMLAGGLASQRPEGAL
jgi:hypothetical protein